MFIAKRKFQKLKLRFERRIEDFINNGAASEIVAYSKYRRFFHRILNKYYHLFSLVDGIQKLKYVPTNFKLNKGGNKLVISLSVWGDEYINLFESVFLPSFLPNSLLSKISKKREILLSIYTASGDVSRIKNITSKLKDIAVTVTDIGNIITNKKSMEDASFRYYVYGALHNADLVVARELYADYLPISPDNVHSNGSLISYLNYLDEGYKVVLVSGIRVQRESILPEILKYYDVTSGELTIPSPELIALAAKNIHHEFRRYFLFENNNKVPELMSLRIFPKKDYFVMNSYHLHPILISKDQLQKINNIDYLTVDAGLIKKMCIEEINFDKEIKIIDDSDIACMADLSALYKDINLDIFVENIYTDGHREKQDEYYSEPINRWNFSKDIIYRSTSMLSYQSFENHGNKLINVTLDGLTE